MCEMMVVVSGITDGQTQGEVARGEGEVQPEREEKDGAEALLLLRVSPGSTAHATEPKRNIRPFMLRFVAFLRFDTNARFCCTYEYGHCTRQNVNASSYTCTSPFKPVIPSESEESLRKKQKQIGRGRRSAGVSARLEEILRRFAPQNDEILRMWRII